MPVASFESGIASFSNEDANVDACQGPRTYAAKQKKVLGLLETVCSVVSDITDVNRSQFAVHYPRQHISNQSDSPPRFRILQLSPPSSGHRRPLLDALDDAAVQSLLEDKFVETLAFDSFSAILELLSRLKPLLNYRHLERLRTRVLDHTSRILVTGDLNSGKSTFVNTLLGLQLLPTDQQPCTSTFCEVVGGGMSGTVHGIPSLDIYDPTDPNTFLCLGIHDIQLLAAKEEPQFSWLKIFLGDSSEHHLLSDALDLSLIDSPGLNHDTIQTMSLFAKQDDIDIIVFVVNAANHLTLSATEFLSSASKEKDRIFLVVNKFDDIRNQEKCRRMILQQVSQILPATFEDSSDLVHFVSAREGVRGTHGESWIQLETSLRSFALEKRSKSKLAPCRTFIYHLLSDLVALSIHNIRNAALAIERVESANSLAAPLRSKLEVCRNAIWMELDSIVENAASKVYVDSGTALAGFVDEMFGCIDIQVHFLVPWIGVLNLPKYIGNCVAAVESIAVSRVKTCRQNARVQSIAAIRAIQTSAISSFSELLVKEIEISNTDGDVNSIQIGFSWWSLLDLREEAMTAGRAVLTSLVGGGVAASFFKMSFGRKSILAGLSIAMGAALFGIWLDMQATVTRKITHNMAIRMRDIGWAEKRASELAQSVRTDTRPTLAEIQRRFYAILSEQDRLQTERDSQHRMFVQKLGFFQTTQKKLNTLILETESLTL